MDGRVHRRVSWKKISTLIKKYSGNSGRERRAFEEEPEEKKQTNSIYEIDRKEAVESFKFGNYVFIYYKYLSKFHVEPDSWAALFEFMDYAVVDNKIESVNGRQYRDSVKLNRKKGVK